ncbi:MAG: hypothetical protein IIC24_09455 [Chloroflexi bacterium]|nr:hypothetical protein [Chloroflexota bacterium]
MINSSTSVSPTDKIQIAREMYELLCDDVVCLPVGIVGIKGKGEMDTWRLKGWNSG